MDSAPPTLQPEEHLSDHQWHVFPVLTGQSLVAGGRNSVLTFFASFIILNIDPAKVTRSIVKNAASTASMILTTEALITDLPEKEKPAAPAGMPEYKKTEDT
jgi:hypothetical protein